VQNDKLVDVFMNCWCCLVWDWQ